MENQKTILTSEKFTMLLNAGENINVNAYELTLDKLPIDLIDFISIRYAGNYSLFKSRYLRILFDKRYFLHKTDDFTRLNLNTFNDTFYHIVYRNTIDDVISLNAFANCLYSLIEVLNARYELMACDIENVLFSGMSYDIVKYYDENGTFKRIRKDLIENTQGEIVQYRGDYYHIENCVNAYIDYNITELIPLQFTYLYNMNYYTIDGLRNCDLVLYQGDIYHMDDCVYCEDTGNTIHIDDAFYCDDSECWYENESSIEDKNGLRGYHKSEIKDKSNNSIYKIGFEVEKEDSDIYNFKSIREYGWDAEHDGSLNDDGFELVSPIYDMMNIEEFSKDMQSISDYINADYSSNCGGHINVSVYGKDAIDIFELIRGYLPLIYAMYPNRLDNRYAKAKKVSEFNNCDRYEAINFTKGHILEFRIFSAVRNTKNLEFRYKLIQYMFKNQRKGAASVVRMLLTDSDLKKLLLTVYDASKYDKLVERAIKFTDIYMSQRDIKTTTSLINKMKSGQSTLEELINN